MAPGTAHTDADLLLLHAADVFDLQAADTALRKLVGCFNRQALETRQLRDQLRELATQQREDALRATAALDERLVAVSDRLEKLETSVCLQRERERRAELRVARLEAAAREAASERKEIREDAARAERAVAEALEKLRVETASFEVVTSLHEDQQLLQDRVSTLDRRLDAKMEKTEAARIEAHVTKIHSFAKRSDQLTEQLGALRASHAELSNALAARDNRLRNYEQQLSRCVDQANAMALKLNKLERLVNDNIVEMLMDQSEKLRYAEDTIGNLAMKSSSSEAARRSLSAKFHSITSALAEQMKSQGETFQTLVSDRATNADVAQQIADVKSDLSHRAYSDDLQSLIGVVESLSTQCTSLEKHVELSSRFMNWFASRGEAYEHNFDVVEAQLERLAFHSRPENRDPFAGQVRYPHPHR